MVHKPKGPVAVGLAGAVCISSSAIFMRLADWPAGPTALFRCVFALPFLGVLALAEHRRGARMPARARWLARLSGVFFAGALIFWSPAISAIGAGLSTVLTNLQVLVIPPLAWLLFRERPRRSLLLALPVMVGGVILIAGVAGSHSYGAHPMLGAAYGLLVSVMYSVFILLMQRATSAPTPGGSRVPVAMPLYEATLGAAVSSLAFTAVVGQYHVGHWTALGWLLLLALTSQVVGWMLITVSMPRLPAGIVGAVLLVQPAGAVALGAVVLGERPSLAQLLGVGLVLAGVLAAVRGSEPEHAADQGGTAIPGVPDACRESLPSGR
jgi:drug/metabolite transporter (DMT)-like permease